MGKAVSSEPKISADDLRRKIQSFQDGIQGKVDDKKNTLLTAGGVALLVLLILVFLLGKRNGRKKTTLVEIRRV
jgi:LPXTG-motif cell wall-anchored protein